MTDEQVTPEETGDVIDPKDVQPLPPPPARPPVQLMDMQQLQHLIESSLKLQARIWTQLLGHLGADAEKIRQLDEAVTILRAKAWVEQQADDAV